MEATNLKAAFLYRFAGLATWPGSAFPTADTPFRFGVVGDADFAGELRSVVEGISPFAGVHGDIKSLKTRIAELEEKLSRMVERDS